MSLPPCEGRLGSRVIFAKSNKRGTWGGLFVSRKASKRRFLCYFLRRAPSPQSPQGRFYVTFSLVRKSNQKVPQRSADLWTPGERFKTRAGGFQVKVERFCALRFFGKFYKCHNTHGHVLNRRKRAVAVLTQNRILQKIEVAVQA